MSVSGKKGIQSPSGNREIIHFRLYIAEGTPNSVRAMANLKSVCQEYLHGRHKVEVVDILQEPLRALSEGVLVTPTLVRLSPLPVRKIVGDLSDTATVLQALGLEGGAK
jgi:circadian clock protein KaiB